MSFVCVKLSKYFNLFINIILYYGVISSSIYATTTSLFKFSLKLPSPFC